MNFQISALPVEPFIHLFGLPDASLRAHGAQRVVADKAPGYPCRVSLQDAGPGETLLLLSYEHQPAPTPYRASHAIYVREHSHQALPRRNEVPLLFRHRLLSLRSFSGDGMLLDADVAEGTDLEAALSRMLAPPDAAYLHLSLRETGLLRRACGPRARPALSNAQPSINCAGAAALGRCREIFFCDMLQVWEWWKRPPRHSRLPPSRRRHLGRPIMMRIKLLHAASIAAVCVPLTAPAATLNVIYTFGAPAGGQDPAAPLALDQQGNLYGVTTRGGHGNGVIFRLSPSSGGTWQETVLYSFPAKLPSVGLNGGLLIDADGSLYGTAYGNYAGFAFRLAPPAPGNSAWRYQTLFNFPGEGSPLGGGPSGVLTRDVYGDLVGVTQYGGDQSGAYPCLCGVAYSLVPPTSGNGWQETILHTFQPIPDGNIPVSGLTASPEGILFGTTFQGGTGQCLDGSDVEVVGCGTIFSLAPGAGGWTETILYNFRLNEGNEPTDPLTIGPHGALFGVAGLDVFRLRFERDGTPRKHTIYSFAGGISGTAPTGGVVFDPAGNMYGATRSFGVEGPAAVYQLSPPASGDANWTETTLATLGHSLNAPQPWGGIVRGPDGTLYGAAGRGVTNHHGYVFAVTP